MQRKLVVLLNYWQNHLLNYEITLDAFSITLSTKITRAHYCTKYGCCSLVVLYNQAALCVCCRPLGLFSQLHPSSDETSFYHTRRYQRQQPGVCLFSSVSPQSNSLMRSPRKGPKGGIHSPGCEVNINMLAGSPLTQSSS